MMMKKIFHEKIAPQARLMKQNVPKAWLPDG